MMFKTDWQPSPTFDELYAQFHHPVFCFAYHLTRNRNEAEDLFQEAWLRIVKHLPERVNMGSLKTWMFTIVINLHRDNLRKKKVRRMFSFGSSKEEREKEEYLMEASGSESQDETYNADLGRDIARALDELPEKQRQVFVLKEISGFKQLEISEILELPLGTVKSLMYRAVKRLQKELKDYQSGSMVEGVKDAL
jgi:RNA polymerase sigma-70 factor (ECF subfamily)